MSSEPARPPRPGPPAGLCDTCGHRVTVRNTRGSVFSLCGRSRQDPAYPRYPRLPVLACDGYEPNATKRAAGERVGDGASS
ncbi:MAG TPA: hypothetical protein VES65_00535 [Solirubrobacteraceae bacterium]|nr:hypothetical protein [Solirubrobacteraceae bacterium]